MDWKMNVFSEQTGKLEEYGDKIPVFMAGDFNEVPWNAPIVELMVNKHDFIDIYSQKRFT